MSAFADIVAELKGCDRDVVTAKANQIVAAALTDGDETPPRLRSDEQVAEDRERIAGRVAALIKGMGYSDSAHRLAGSEEDARSARDAVALRLWELEPQMSLAEAQKAVKAAGTTIAPYFDASFGQEWGAPPKDWSTLVDGLIVDGLTHWIGGTHGALKSTVGAHAAVTAMDSERDVVWLDWEVGRDQARGKLWLAGARDGEQVRQLFHYVNGANLRDDGMAKLLGEAGAMNRPFVVIDSASKALASLGLNENDNGDVSAFTAKVLVPLKAAGATLYVIDHAGRSQSASSDYVARGASTKDADADLTYRFDATEPPTRTSVGKLRVVCQKDRESARGEGWNDSRHSRFGERWYDVGDGAGGLPITPADQPSEAHKAALFGDLRRAIVARASEANGEVVAQRTLREDLRARGLKFRDNVLPGLLREMDRDPDEPVKAVDGGVQYATGHGVGLPIGGRA